MFHYFSICSTCLNLRAQVVALGLPLGDDFVKVAAALLEDGGVGAEAVALARDLVQLARQPHLQSQGISFLCPSRNLEL